MNNALSIRPAAADDAPLVLSLIRELAAYEHLQHEVTASVDDLHRTLFGPEPCARVLLAFWDGRPAGLAIYFFNYSTFRGRAGLYLEDIFVKPGFRSRGIGKALFAQLSRVAIERGCARFEWSVLDWNQPAIDFYKKAGARPHPEWIRFRLEPVPDLSKTIADL